MNPPECWIKIRVASKVARVQSVHNSRAQAPNSTTSSEWSLLPRSLAFLNNFSALSCLVKPTNPLNAPTIHNSKYLASTTCRSCSVHLVQFSWYLFQAAWTDDRLQAALQSCNRECQHVLPVSVCTQQSLRVPTRTMWVSDVLVGQLTHSSAYQPS